MKNKIELTDQEKEIMTLALHRLSMEQGPPAFEISTQICIKIGTLTYFKSLVQSWSKFATNMGLDRHSPG